MREESAAGCEVPLGLGGETVAVGAAAECDGGDIAGFVGGVAVEVNRDESFAFAAGIAPFDHLEPVHIPHGVVGGGAVAGVREVRVAVGDRPVPDILPSGPSDFGGADAEAGHGVARKPRGRRQCAALDKGKLVPEREVEHSGGGAVRGGGGNGDRVIPGEGGRAGDGSGGGVEGEAGRQAAGTVGGRAPAGREVRGEGEAGGAIDRGCAGDGRPRRLDDNDQVCRNGVVGIDGLDGGGIAAGGGGVAGEEARGGIERQPGGQAGGIVGNRIRGGEGLVDRGCGQLDFEGCGEIAEHGHRLHDADGERFGIVGVLAVGSADRRICGAARGRRAGNPSIGKREPCGKPGGIRGFKVSSTNRVDEWHAPGGIGREGRGDPGEFGIAGKPEADGRVDGCPGGPGDGKRAVLGGPTASHGGGWAGEFPRIAIHVVKAELVRGLARNGA